MTVMARTTIGIRDFENVEKFCIEQGFRLK